MRKILVFTGSRANYSSTRAIMKSIMKSPDLELQAVIGGSAIIERYGNIESLMMDDKIPIDAKFHMLVEGETPVTMSKSVGLGIIDLSMIFDNLKPDVVVVVGDRFDVMAPTIVAAYMNIPIAHTMGGEVSGTIDESIRHAITKFSHVHFSANIDAKERIIKMGEDPDMVFDVGCPRMDMVREKIEFFEKTPFDHYAFFQKHKGVGCKFDIVEEKFLLVSQHPVTTEFGKNRGHIEDVLYALNELKINTIMLWPNSDAGSDEVTKGIRSFRENHNPKWLHLFINLPFDVYLQLMSMTSCLIGNSSSGVREGAFIGTPVVNIGSRQNRRMKGKNVIDVNNNKKEIVNAIEKQLEHGKYRRDALYGDGHAGVKITKILSQIQIDNIQKTIQY